MMSKYLAVLLMGVLAGSVAAGVPERTASGHTVVSTHDPRLQVDVPGSATYIGGDRWIIKEYADDVELHAFADLRMGNQVERLYWLQFEAYLPSHPEFHHSYDSKRHVTLGGMDFLVDTWVKSTATEDEPDSDTAHLKALLGAKGYRLPASMMSVRFVHLMDDGRKELMFIYSEDLAPRGLTAADLAPGGKDHGQWPTLESALIARGMGSLRFR